MWIGTTLHVNMFGCMWYAFVPNWISLYGGIFGTAQSWTTICGLLLLLFPLLSGHTPGLSSLLSLFLPFRSDSIFRSMIYLCHRWSLRCAFIACALCYHHQLWALMPVNPKCAVMRCAFFSLVHFLFTISITRCAFRSLAHLLPMLTVVLIRWLSMNLVTLATSPQLKGTVCLLRLALVPRELRFPSPLHHSFA